jgi:hypothetical protein
MNYEQKKYLKGRIMAAETALRHAALSDDRDVGYDDKNPELRRARKLQAEARRIERRLYDQQTRRRMIVARKLDKLRRPVDEAMLFGDAKTALAAIVKYEKRAAR